jgi:hypothetical protein
VLVRSNCGSSIWSSAWRRAGCKTDTARVAAPAALVHTAAEALLDAAPMGVGTPPHLYHLQLQRCACCSPCSSRHTGDCHTAVTLSGRSCNCQAPLVVGLPLTLSLTPHVHACCSRCSSWHTAGGRTAVTLSGRSCSCQARQAAALPLTPHTRACCSRCSSWRTGDCHTEGMLFARSCSCQARQAVRLRCRRSVGQSWAPLNSTNHVSHLRRCACCTRCSRWHTGSCHRLEMRLGRTRSCLARLVVATSKDAWHTPGSTCHTDASCRLMLPGCHSCTAKWPSPKHSVVALQQRL